MKKKILATLMIAVLGLGLILLTGCVKKNEGNTNTIKTSGDDLKLYYVTIGNNKYQLNDETELKDLHYLRNYVDFNTDQVGNTKSMSFNYEGAFSFEVRVNCEEEHSLEEVKDVLKEHEEKTKEVNGIKYFYYEYKSNLSDDVHYYLYQHNNRVYSIIFFLGANHGDIEEVFMDAVKFK